LPRRRSGVAFDGKHKLAEGWGREETGFNPKTQQKIKIPAKTVVKFRVAKAAKDGFWGIEIVKEPFSGKPSRRVCRAPLILNEFVCD
jgi:Bacterial DNA-binding protein